MVKIPEEYEDLLNWSKGQLNIEEFCEKWVPKLYEIQSTNKDFKSASVALLTRVTDRNDRTVYNWLSKRRSVPTDIKKLLFFMDLTWDTYYGLKSSEDKNKLN